MKIVDLYYYVGENGGAVQTPVKIAGASYKQMYRLIADDGKVLTDGTNLANIIDVEADNKTSWTEIYKNN